MIKILDRYVLKKFIGILIMAMAAMIMVYIIIDLFDHLNKFLDAKMPLIGYILYYTLKIPEIISQLFPVVVFMSLLFTLGGLNKYNEITAMMTSGISLMRISAPLIIFGILLSIGHFYFTEFIVPYSSREHYEAKDYYLDNGVKFHRKMNEFVYQEKNSIVYISSFDVKTGIASGVSIQNIRNGTIDFRIDAEKMLYENSMWKLLNLAKRSFAKDSTKYAHLDSLSLMLDFEPKDIAEIELKPIEMGYFELNEYIEKKKELGADMTKWEVEKLSKVSYSAITLILILIAIPMSTGRARSATSVNFGISVGIAFVYYLLIIMFKNWGAVGQIDPLTAAWAPNLIFGIMGLFLIRKAR
ncbi:MAG TPA: LPS export ABC transporter permease LptG [Clostridiales bacterium]|nr:LPS export ABC transporter permease LptG [Clostridiales bacterium]HQP70663.1 LPS export ABC transporter permease LptG [Clostridiales bacterium]